MVEHSDGADRAESINRLLAANARLDAQLLRCRQGLRNILEFRKLTSDVWGTRDGYGGRYGALTREELESVIAEIDAARKEADLLEQPEVQDA